MTFNGLPSFYINANTFGMSDALKHMCFAVYQEKGNECNCVNLCTKFIFIKIFQKALTDSESGVVSTIIPN